MTGHIHRRSLALQFLEKQAGLLVDILMKKINEINNEDHLNAPRGLQDEGVPVGNVDLEEAMISHMMRRWALRMTRPLHLVFTSISHSLLHRN